MTTTEAMLLEAGAYWGTDQLMRRMVPSLYRGPRERKVAPPGMPIEIARERRLDFLSPQYGWIRAGIKREREDFR